MLAQPWLKNARCMPAGLAHRLERPTGRQSRIQTTAPATYAGAAILPGKLTIAGLLIDDCCVWRSGTLESSIVNEQIVNWSVPLKAVNTRNFRGPQRNGALVTQGLLGQRRKARFVFYSSAPVAMVSMGRIP